MQRTREILRQKWVLGRSHRETAASLGVSVGAVGKTMQRAQRAGLDWAEAEALDDLGLQERLYGDSTPLSDRPEPDCAWIHTEKKRPGVTLQLLHLEYLSQHPTGLQYTQFCERYRQWRKRQKISMRQVHRAGDKMFVDFAGKRPCLTDPKTGDKVPVEVFVAVMGASNYVFATAVASQKGPDWIDAHCEAFAFFGGVPRVVVPDQLKSGVSKSCRYEPKIQRTYEEMARHYNTVVFPARPRKPKDKAKVEVSVQLVTRWVTARIRNETFYTLEALNIRIEALVEDLNERVMRRYGQSRKALFERLDVPALRPLPKDRFQYGEWCTATVHIDYHVAVNHHFYSVPCGLRGERVDVRVAARTVEIFHRRQRVAVHARSYQRGHYTTELGHMPPNHQAQENWNPERLVHWAATVGPDVAQLAQHILKTRSPPELGYRTVLGIIRLQKKYGSVRVNQACARALQLGATSYRHVATTLKSGLEGSPIEPQRVSNSETPQPVHHENVRGPGYYN